MIEPTKRIEHTTYPNPAGEEFVQQHFESLHSVELTCSAKGLWRVSTVKMYGQDPRAIAVEIAEVARTATQALEATGLPVEKG